jgi:hypothetical protein
VIDKGQIVYTGTTEELKASDSLPLSRLVAGPGFTREAYRRASSLALAAQQLATA